MSAYVVDPKTINRVLTWLKNESEGGKWFHDQVNEILAETEFDVEDLQDLGQAMYNLNINAVSQRYPHCETTRQLPGSFDEDGELCRFRFRPVPARTIQVYKSLQCWRYQCTEGNATETALYKAFEQILDIIAHRLVQAIPEYDKAEWA